MSHFGRRNAIGRQHEFGGQWYDKIKGSGTIIFVRQVLRLSAEPRSGIGGKDEGGWDDRGSASGHAEA